MTEALDVTHIRNIIFNELFYALQPIIIDNPYMGDENDLNINPHSILTHISNVLRLMKERCNHFDWFGTFHPCIEARIQRISSEEYFNPGEIHTFMFGNITIHDLSFLWDGYECSVIIENGNLKFVHNRAFGCQCEFSGGFYDQQDWDHEDLPIGLFTSVLEVFNEININVQHEPSGDSFQEKMNDTIWYVFYRLYRAGFVNALKGFDDIPEDELDWDENEEEWNEEDDWNDEEEEWEEFPEQVNLFQANFIKEFEMPETFVAG